MNKEYVVLVPIYNPDEEITTKFLSELSATYENVVIVDDGCTKEHSEFFKKLAKSYPIIKHNVNLGKGRGIKNGINYILNNYPDALALVTADCDGQHSVTDIGKVLKVAKKYPASYVIGVRDFNQKDVPTKSMLGNKITRNILYTFVGEKISDTQTGLRAMSLEVAKKMIAIPGERYEYETNTLIDAKKLNIPIKEVVIKTIYIEENRTSHFDPIKDSARIYKFFAKYFIVSLIAYIIENILFSNLMNVNINLVMGIPLFILLAKILSSIITYVFNKHVRITSKLISFIVSSIILILLRNTGINLLPIKIIIDIIIFILVIVFTNFTTKKES